MKAAVKTKINEKIHPLCDGPQSSIPLSPIFDILDEFGVVPLQEDNTKWSGLISAPVEKNVKLNFELGDKSTGHDLHGEMAYTPYVNANMVMTIYKYVSGRFEIVCYVG